jgi:hypothetical protein
MLLPKNVAGAMLQYMNFNYRPSAAGVISIIPCVLQIVQLVAPECGPGVVNRAAVTAT